MGDHRADPRGESYVPYVSAAERRRRSEREGRRRRRGGGVRISKGTGPDERTARSDAVPIGGVEAASIEAGGVRSKSLVEQALDLKETNPGFEEERRREEEQAFLKTVTAKQTALVSSKERAEGAKFVDALETGWRPRKRARVSALEKAEQVRKKYHIIVEGDDVPPPLRNFRDMKVPRVLRAALDQRGIKKPTPIQVQGLPVALSGRDMVGIAFTGSGKTLTFSMPLVLMALGEELKCPLVGREGPVGLILGPSRELMTQTFEVVKYMTAALEQDRRFPRLRTMLAIGGQDRRAQVAEHRSKGTHAVIATPGRLNDMLGRGDINLDICRFLCLDEGDRMMDEGFDEEVQKTLGFFKLQRQTLLFSATMPKKFVDFAQGSLVKPIVVNVGRAGAASLDVIQEVEFVKQESKIVYLLQCLQKSPPPVVIFCENKSDVDSIVEYLLLKGVEAVAIHGGKSQDERNHAIESFKDSTKDVLVATDVAAKGLDFPNIQHVINFDMPSEIENYVHRIGRTGRSGRTGIATTFINHSVDTPILLDLKYLLAEAKQRIPPLLMQLEDPEANSNMQADGDHSCAYCGGPGHRITNCPKLQSTIKGQQASHRDVVGNAAYGGDW